MSDHERIWLQPGPDEYNGRTWCEDKINDDDTEYIRLDVHAAEIERAQKDYAEDHTELMGWRAEARELAVKSKAAEDQLVLQKAAAEGAGSLLLDVQQECIALRAKLNEYDSEWGVP